MPSRAVAAVVAGLSLTLCACAPALPASAPSGVLPLRSVRLYETGVGYFERSGTMGAPTSLPVPAGHLDDALETLVVLSGKGGSKVRGVEFGSSIGRGMARALAGLPVDGDEPLGLQQILLGLRGAAVEVRAHEVAYKGRVVDVVLATSDGVAVRQPAAGAAEAQADIVKPPANPAALTLLVLTDAGAVVRVPVSGIESVRPLDPGYAARLGSALDALSSQSARTERMLSVLGGGGDVTLGYVAETPVWRTTYRVVLDRDGAGGTLQGWALLHNDTDEDWRGVHVELANGRPDSFLFPLAAPRYTRRQLISPEDQLASVPQLLETTVDAMYGDQVSESSAGGIGLSGIGTSGGGMGYGSGHGRLGGTFADDVNAATSSTVLAVGSLASLATAEGAEAGALFVYRLADGVDLRAHGSTLVPFAEHHVDARATTWLASPGSTARSAVRFVNSTPQTLPSGTVAFFSEGGFAGQSALPRLKPGERRFVTYGVDLDVELTTRTATSTEEPKRLVWDAQGKRLVEHFLRTSDATYAIENRSGQRRSVVLVTSLDRNATLTGADEVDFDAASSRPLAVFSVDAAKKVERKVHSVEGLERGTAIATLTSARLVELAAAPTLDARDRAAAVEAAARLKEAQDDAASAAQAKSDIVEVDKDLARLREHMKALAGDHPAGGPGANPFATRVLAAEDRLTALRKRVDAVESHEKGRRDASVVALARLTATN